MRGNVETFEYGKDKKKFKVYRFLVHKDANTVWSAIKNFDFFIAVLNTKKGQTTRESGENGELGTIYRCEYPGEFIRKNAIEVINDDYQIIGIDNAEKTLSLAGLQTTNKKALKKIESYFSVEPYTLNHNFSLVEWKEKSVNKERGQWFCYCLRGYMWLMLLLFVWIMMVNLEPLITGNYSNKKKEKKLKVETIGLLRDYLSNYQQEVAGSPSEQLNTVEKNLDYQQQEPTIYEGVKNSKPVWMENKLYTLCFSCAFALPFLC
eukprot:maker-scaffold_2-snap-gene-13.45-mRNA-1 protein AED:0.36 eAED:1.00 QI:0/0/0/1/1/1/2/0/262